MVAESPSFSNISRIDAEVFILLLKKIAEAWKPNERNKPQDYSIALDCGSLEIHLFPTERRDQIVMCSASKSASTRAWPSPSSKIYSSYECGKNRQPRSIKAAVESIMNLLKERKTEMRGIYKVAKGKATPSKTLTKFASKLRLEYTRDARTAVLLKFVKGVGIEAADACATKVIEHLPKFIKLKSV